MEVCLSLALISFSFYFKCDLNLLLALLALSLLSFILLLSVLDLFHPSGGHFPVFFIFIFFSFFLSQTKKKTGEIDGAVGRARALNVKSVMCTVGESETAAVMAEIARFIVALHDDLIR